MPLAGVPNENCDEQFEWNAMMATWKSVISSGATNPNLRIVSF